MLKPSARPLLLAVGFVLAASAVARAQAPTWEDRAFVNVNLGFQLTGRQFAQTLTPVIYDERASVVTTHVVDGGSMPVDVGGGVRIWRSLGVGADYTHFAVVESAALDASVPHPILFNRPRSASTQVPLNHVESSIHFQAVWVLPITERLDVALSGGPSLMTVKQDLVSGIQIAEDSPTFTTVAIAKVGVVSQNQRIVGFNGGADVTYFLTPLIGVGLTVRYVAGSAALSQSDGSTIALEVGGLQLGVGARLRLR